MMHRPQVIWRHLIRPKDIWQNDNGPTRSIFSNKESKQVQQMVRPLQGPDLHIMETVWDYVTIQMTL